MGTTGSNWRHEWESEEARGPTSAGTCRICGAYREGFKNEIDVPFFIDWKTIHRVYRTESDEELVDVDV